MSECGEETGYIVSCKECGWECHAGDAAGSSDLCPKCHSELVFEIEAGLQFFDRRSQGANGNYAGR